MSLDFHPKKTDLFCSCDGNNEIRFWNINAANCFRVIKARPPELSYCFSPSLNSYFLIFELSNGQGASTQVRFQPRFGQMLAAASENTVSIYDYDNDRRVHLLKVTPEDNIYILLTYCAYVSWLGLFFNVSGAFRKCKFCLLEPKRRVDSFC